MPTTGSKRKRSDETPPDDQAEKEDSNPNQVPPEVQSKISKLQTPPRERDGRDDGEGNGNREAKEEPYKVFNDSVHGHIEIHPLCVKIIDTPQFQRLRDLKQLGGCYFVFPGASHNRFEHSIGTCYLAGKLVESLRHNQRELKITDRDVLCVKIAGLCHDLGHGPFSHMFDASFIPEATKDKKWKHEDGSLAMFEHIMEANKLIEEFPNYDLRHEDVVFIKELIKPPEKTTSKDWPCKGREKEKSFLYEIVANKRTGIDVDKFDYFARDCHGLGIKNSFDHERYIKFAKVLKVNGENQICVRDKEVNNICDMFHARSSLHRRAYQHKTANSIEIMIKDAFLLADKKVCFEGKDRKKLPISGCIDDMEAYTKLSDNVYYQILYSSDIDSDLEKARAILRRIQDRDLYRCIGQTPLTNETISNIKKDVEESVKDYKGADFQPDDFVTDVAKFDYGMKDKNPLDELSFYSKSNPKVAIPFREIQVSHMLPEKFQEHHLRVYFRKNDKELLKNAESWFKQWWNNYIQKGRDAQVEQTPMMSSEKGGPNALEKGGLNASQRSEIENVKRSISFEGESI